MTGVERHTKRPNGGMVDAIVSKTIIYWMCRFNSYLGYIRLVALTINHLMCEVPLVKLI